MEGRQIMAENDVYEVFALRYAERLERTRRESFIFADAHDSPHPIDYFVWVARNQSRTLVIDTGFDQEESRLRDRKILRLPAEALAMVDVDAQSVSDVIITHMHYDHAGTLQDFPAARFHLQADEMAYVTGPSMCQGDLSHPFTADHVCQMVRNVYSGRVSFSDGDAQIAPNITVHKIGGHTRGLQCVRVLTRRGWVVLASDASHFYENVQEEAVPHRAGRGGHAGGLPAPGGPGRQSRPHHSGPRPLGPRVLPGPEPKPRGHRLPAGRGPQDPAAMNRVRPLGP
jgi:glyoxylase-like metal-dependent hydrolase (beta-lactamase superfamily II)